jgi:hypothetical protein
MAGMLLCDASTCFYLLLVGLLFVAALFTPRNGHSPACVDVRAVGRLPTRLHRLEERVSSRLTGPDFGRARDPGSGAFALEVYARQFGEAIKSIRLGGQGFRGAS